MKVMVEQSSLDQTAELGLLRNSQDQLIQVAELLERHVTNAFGKLTEINEKLDQVKATGFQNLGDVDESTFDDLTNRHRVHKISKKF